MKKRYFKYVEIDKEVVSLFFNHHPKMKEFINVDQPFYVRVSRKPYPALIHHVICQDIDSNTASAIAARLEEATGRVTPRWVNKLSDSELIAITANQQKADLIRKITNDVVSKKINLRKLIKQDTKTIVNALSYPGLNFNTLKQFALFGCFKQDVLCSEDPDFIEGLKIYLNKKDITNQDIINIANEYEPQLTLFSLCMWRIVNERKLKCQQKTNQ